MPAPAKYNSKLDAEGQIDTEEAIAAFLSDQHTNAEATLSEEDFAEMGRVILRVVLERFRPDLFIKGPKRGKEEKVEEAGGANNLP